MTTMWMQVFESADLCFLIANSCLDVKKFQRRVRMLACVSKRLQQSEFFEALIKKHVSSYRPDMAGYADYCATIKFLLPMIGRQPRLLMHYATSFQLVAQVMPFMHDHNTMQETHRQVRQYVSGEYRKHDVASLIIGELEREPLDGESSATKEHAMQFLHRCLYIMNGSIEILIDLEESAPRDKERLSVAVANYYNRAPENASVEINCIYIMESLSRFHISESILNALVHRFCNAARRREIAIATFVHGVIVRVTRNTSDPYVLGRYVRDNDIIRNVLNAYITELSQISVELCCCYHSVLFAFLRCSHGLNLFSMEVQVQFQIIFTYTMAVSEYLALQALQLCIELVASIHPAVNLVSSASVFVREIWHAVLRYGSRQLEFLSLKCMEKISDAVRLRSEDWHYVGLAIARCAQPMWAQTLQENTHPLQSATATRIVCTKMYMRAVQTLHRDSLTPLGADILNHLIFVFEYFDCRGPLHTMKELKLALAMFAQFRFNARRTFFAPHMQQISKLQKVFGVLCARVCDDSLVLGVAATHACKDLAYYLVGASTERDVVAEEQFLCLSIRMGPRSLSSKTLHKAYRLFIATASEKIVSREWKKISMFIFCILKNRYPSFLTATVFAVRVLRIHTYAIPTQNATRLTLAACAQHCKASTLMILTVIYCSSDTKCNAPDSRCLPSIAKHPH